ncbi:72 kDa type IV collagenase-like [Anneissia japonica]|uniref:72 kDa type IV collagenase-like n=1 Tax=Anneissia japonica TaxID=1529436 RepID=UPI00142578F8|nr:72 kDa type IV collagenase-like [Anneissia japonica]
MKRGAFNNIKLVQYLIVLCCYALSSSKAMPISDIPQTSDMSKQKKHGPLIDVDTMSKSSFISSETTSSLSSSSSLSSISDSDDIEQFINPPKCGKSGENGDETANGMRQKRYIHIGGKWSKSKVTYRILNYPKRGKPSKAKIHKNIARAFDIWEAATNLKMEQVYSGEADIYVSFAKGRHGDAYPFDGKGGWLAHAFYPRSGHGDMNGDIHFDDSEKFSLRPGKAGYNFFYVASHEIGHSLGLGHSQIEGALMHDAYPSNPYNVKLTDDDVDGIQALYGVPDNQTNEVLEL